MAGQQLVINASFFENGTCSYEVLLNGQQVARNIVGIVTTWAELLQLVSDFNAAWASEAQRTE